MDFKRKGLSWVENLCQKLEVMCTDNAIMQNSLQCLDVAGHSRNTIDDVANNSVHPSGAYLGDQVSKLSLVNSDVYENLRLDHSSNEKSTCTTSGSTVPRVETISLTTSPNVSQNSSQTGASIDGNYKLKKNKFNSCSSTVVSFPYDRRENSKAALELIASPIDVTGDQSVDGLSSSNENKGMERVSTMSSPISSTEIDVTSASHEIKSLLEYPENECDHQQTEPENIEGSAQLPETGEFEDVHLEDSSDDDINYELSLISYCAYNKKSYKGKLKSVLMSKIRSRRQSIDVSTPYRPEDATSAVSSTSKKPRGSDHDTCELDWEIL